MAPVDFKFQIFGVYVSNVQVRCPVSYAVGSMGWRGSRDEIPIVSRRKDKIVGPLTEQAGGPLALQTLPRVFPEKFLQQFKTTLFSRAVVGSASE